MNYFSRPAVEFKKPSIDEIIKRVCIHFNIDEKMLSNQTRRREIVEPRSIVMYLLHKHLNLTSTTVGERFHRTHATILSSCNKVQGFMDIDKNYRALVNSFK